MVNGKVPLLGYPDPPKAAGGLRTPWVGESLWYPSLAEAGDGITDTAAGDPHEVAAVALPPAGGVLAMAAPMSHYVQ